MSKRRWRDPSARAEIVVRQKLAGMSLRQIAADLRVSHETVRRDLARYASENVDQLIATLTAPSLSHKAVTSGSQCDSDVTAPGGMAGTSQEIKERAYEHVRDLLSGRPVVLPDEFA